MTAAFRNLLTYLLFLAALLLPFSCWAQQWKTYTTADGLVDNQLRDVYQSDDGALWFTTREGLSRYNGTWRTYTEADGLGDNRVEAMLQAGDGAMWFGTFFAGVNRLDENGWRIFGTDDGLASSYIPDVIESNDGTIWAAASGVGVNTFDGETWRLITPEDGLISVWVSAIHQSSEGAIWFATDDGASRFDGTSWQNFSSSVVGISDLLDVEQMADGSLWFGSRGNGVSRYDGADWRVFTVEDGLADNWVDAVRGDRDGNVWFATDGGVSRFDGTTWQTFTMADGLGDDEVGGLLQSSDGSMWFATDNGATQYVNNPANAIYVHQEAKGQVIGNTISRNAQGESPLSAVEITDAGTSPLIQNNTIVANGGGGIFAHTGASPRIVGNTVEGNTVATDFGGGIQVYDSGTNPTVTENSLVGNLDAGLEIRRGAGGLFENNIIDRNGQNTQLSGVWISDSGTNPTIRNNQIRTNVGPGMSVALGAEGTISGNTISRNGQGGEFVADGITIEDRGTMPTVEENLISTNSGDGIWFFSQAGGNILSNEISANAFFGIRVEGGETEPVLRGNRFSGNLGGGILILDGATPQLQSNSGQSTTRQKAVAAKSIHRHSKTRYDGHRGRATVESRSGQRGAIE